MSGKAYLVGAGPGDPGLLTLRAKELIETADVLIYDYLSNADFLDWARPEAEKLYAGKMAGNHTLPQDEINARLVAAVRSGRRVVRLKGGDPYVFGRGGEEAQALRAAGLDFEVIPGITSGIAAPAYAGIPVTHRDHASTVTFITAHEDPAKASSALDWELLARLRGTKVFFMGIDRLRNLAATLVAHGADPTTPTALVRWGTRPQQQTLTGTLATIADEAARVGFQPPAVTIVGSVVTLRHELAWFEQRPLFGRRIVVTRTRTQASGLAHGLRELGADVLEIPTIRVVAHDDRADWNNLGARFDWMLFTSPNAVDHFMMAFLSRHRDLRALGSIRLGAVGPATRRKLADFHLEVEVQPKEFTAAALAECFSEEQMRGRRVLLPRGNLAEPLLPDHLRTLGAEVTEWVIYRTEPETDDQCGARARFLAEGADWITFTSSSTARHWHDLQLRIAAGAKIPRHVSIGPQTSEGLRAIGLPVHVEAAVHTIPGLIQALIEVETTDTV